MTYYDAISEGYERLYKEEQQNKLGIIKGNIKISQNTKILDVGCGRGISSDFDCLVVGIDPSKELIRLNKNNSKLIGVAEFLPFRDNSFDYVISVTAIHNFKSIKKAVAEMKRVGKNNFVFSVLKKSGKFGYIEKLIEENFEVRKIIDEGKDVIYFAKKP